MIHLYFFILGTVFASFLGLVIDRFPEQSIIAPASHCNACGKRLAPRDLIPIVSQVLNRLRCRFCGDKIPLRYLFFECILGGLFLATSLGVLSISQLLLLTMGLTLAVYDQREQQYPLMVWLIFQLLLTVTAGINLLMLFFLALGLLAFFYNLRIGAGDFLFLASCSAVFSLTEALILIQIASFSGLACFCFKKKKDRLAFVPCLLFGAVVLISYKLLLLR
ncbi:putative type IV prepilin peptidase / Late competence protein ComC, processing protease [Streptococcus gordonii]|uniref:Putative type IV prepilin peptidase / Late competence protein ComC, processing protease n=1 Tax=Streptococcus gordonii TaxID=1302 RepID=A0A139N6Y2_STRGN|nr:putative type IV prepilin peptidase / Late competence protein ComC, processing protease [Streptococcus gordonii]